MCSNFVRMDITVILLFHAESLTSFPLERARSITSMDCCESLYSAIFPPILAGVAGFEPTIRGSKPRALPLGYTPVWSWWTDLNPRPVEYKSTALPTELHQHGAPERCRTSNLRTTKAVRYRLRYWCWPEWWDSNPRPHAPKACALPTALHPDKAGIPPSLLASASSPLRCIRCRFLRWCSPLASEYI